MTSSLKSQGQASKIIQEKHLRQWLLESISPCLILIQGTQHYIAVEREQSAVA